MVCPSMQETDDSNLVRRRFVEVDRGTHQALSELIHVSQGEGRRNTRS